MFSVLRDLPMLLQSIKVGITVDEEDTRVSWKDKDLKQLVHHATKERNYYFDYMNTNNTIPWGEIISDFKQGLLI